MYNYYRHLLTYLIIKKKQISDVFTFSKKRKCVVFAVLCEPRSGSTLLHTYLNSHPQIMSHGEILREHTEKGLSEEKIINFLNRSVFDFKSTTMKAVGLKLFYEYYKNTAYQKYFNAILHTQNIRIIHLIRKDILKQFVSLKIAQKTTIWSTNKTTNHHTERGILVDPHEYLKYAQDYKVHQREFDMLFKQHSCLKISYEDIVDNPNDVLESIQLFLDVKPRKLFTLLKKQNRDSLESTVLNYNEIKSLFKS